MASHETVYGTCENKCRHQVFTAEQANNRFLTKTDATRRYAIVNHAVNNNTYGVGTNTVYGHVMVVDNYSGVPAGTYFPASVALGARAGAELYNMIVGLTTRIESLETRVAALEEQLNA